MAPRTFTVQFHHMLPSDEVIHTAFSQWWQLSGAYGLGVTEPLVRVEQLADGSIAGSIDLRSELFDSHVAAQAQEPIACVRALFERLHVELSQEAQPQTGIVSSSVRASTESRDRAAVKRPGFLHLAWSTG